MTMMKQNHSGNKYIATMLLGSRIPLRELHRGHRLKQSRVNGVCFAVVEILHFILNLCNMQKGKQLAGIIQYTQSRTFSLKH